MKRIIIIAICALIPLISMGGRRALLQGRVQSGGGGGGSPAIVNAWKGTASATNVTISVSPTAGNALVVFAVGFEGSGVDHSSQQAVFDNIDGATGWTKMTNMWASYDHMCSVWYKMNVPSGIVRITNWLSTAAGTAQGIVHEMSNVTTFTSGEMIGSATFTPSTNPQTASLSNGTASSIYFAFLCWGENFGNPVTGTVNSTGSSGGTWSLYNSTTSQELDADSWIPMSVPSLVVSSTASRVHGWTLSSSALAYSKVIACFH